jgi:hypothetical protein
MSTKKICFACNEDGFGPSAFAYYVVRAIIETWRASHDKDQLEIWVLNASAYAFNRALYAGFPEVRLASVNSLIRLEKDHGEVSVKRTLERLSQYVLYRAAYSQTVQSYLEGCHIAIDIGVPLFARSAKQAGVPTLTFFDHSWAATVRGICSEEARYYYNPSPTLEDRALADQLAAEIESDEACTGEVFLFDRYITPPEFLRHWEDLGFTPQILPGVLGQREEPDTARKRLNELLLQLDEQPVSADQPLVLISPGGTPVWDRLLVKIIDTYITRGTGKYLPILSRPNVSDEYKDKMRRSAHIRWFDFPAGSTQQVLLPAFEVVVTRAGGGTVNDCLASQTPFVCVEEPQWQVQLIERECKALGLIPDLPETSWPIFQQDPVSCIDTFVIAPRPVPKISVAGGAEKYLANVILSSL